MLKQNENHEEHCYENFDSVVLHRSQVYSLKNSDGNEIDGSIIIVIQSDYINSTSDDTLVLFCSTNYSVRAKIEFSFYLSKFTMYDYTNGRLQKFNSKNFFAIKIKEINSPLDKVLEKYLKIKKVELIKCGNGARIAAEREQWSDGVNTLCVRPGVVIVYDRNYVTNETLRKHGVKVIEIPSCELSRGRGGPHCMSMALERED